MPEAKKGRGCFFYGCITLIVVVILAIVAIFFGVRFGIKFMRDHYTSTKPIAVEPANLSPAEAARVTQRVDDFKKAVQTGAAAAPLELNGDELDYVFRNTPGNGLKDHARLAINDDHIHAQLSMPLDMQGPAWFGRFLNGEADIAVTLRGGAPSFQLQHVRVNGQSLPSWAPSNITQPIDWRPDPNDPNASIITNLDKVEVTDGKIILFPKKK